MLRDLRSLLIICCLFIALSPPAFAQQERVSLPVKEMIAAPSFLGFGKSITLSPDGESVAYEIQDPRRREVEKDRRYFYYTRTGADSRAVGCDVWITNTKSGESKNLTGGKGANWGPVWSPDGNLLAFYSDRSGLAHLWVWEKSSGSLRQVSDAIIRPAIETIRWTPDSRKILVKVLVEGITVEDAAGAKPQTAEQTGGQKQEPQATVVVYSSLPTRKQPIIAKSDGIALPSPRPNPTLTELALIEVLGGKIQRGLTRGFNPQGYSISPDGTYVAFLTPKGAMVGTTTNLSDLIIVSLTDARARVVASGIPRGQDIFYRVSWSPDGKLLSYVTSAGDCFVASVNGGEPRKVHEGTHPNVYG